MKTLNYKGFIGSIEISEADNCLYGKILNLPNNTEITYEGETVSQLKEDFKGAIDDYLIYCNDNGLEPKRSYSGSLNLRLTPEIHTKIAIIAKETGVSINTFIRKALEIQLSSII